MNLLKENLSLINELFNSEVYMQGKKKTEQAEETNQNALRKQFDNIRTLIGSMDLNQFSLKLTHNTGILGVSSSASSKDDAYSAIKSAISKTDDIEKLLSAKEKLEASKLNQAGSIVKLIKARIEEIEKKKLPEKQVVKQNTVSDTEVAEMQDHIENLFHEANLNEIESLDKELEELNSQLGGAREVIEVESKAAKGLNKISVKIDSFMQKIRDIRSGVQLPLLEKELNKAKNKEPVLDKFSKLISETNDPKIIERANDMLLKYKKSHPESDEPISKVVKIGSEKWNKLSQEEKVKPRDWAGKNVGQARKEASSSVQEKNDSSTRSIKK